MWRMSGVRVMRGCVGGRWRRMEAEECVGGRWRRRSRREAEECVGGRWRRSRRGAEDTDSRRFAIHEFFFFSQDSV